MTAPLATFTFRHVPTKDREPLLCACGKWPCVFVGIALHTTDAEITVEGDRMRMVFHRRPPQLLKVSEPSLFVRWVMLVASAIALPFYALWLLGCGVVHALRRRRR